MEHCHANVTGFVGRDLLYAARRKTKNRTSDRPVILCALRKICRAEEKLGNEQLIRHQFPVRKSLAIA